jgi:sugar/nucleoside kinase (ribokinase family)
VAESRSYPGEVGSRVVTLCVVGSVAFDAVETPFGRRERMLGGSAVHFALAASFFTDVRVVGVVGEDFGEAELRVLEARAIDTEDLERVPGKTFFWAGRYSWDLNSRDTLDTQLNVFADFQPKLSEASREARVLFLGNIQPDLQREVRAQCDGAIFAALDSMNLWIDVARDSLLEAIRSVDCVILNDAETRMLTEEPNLARAARHIRDLGPRIVVAKQGEYGAALFTEEGFFSLPGYPLETVVDPTGAGDTFAGGFLGYLAAHAGDPLTEDHLRSAMTYGSVVASFNVEEFGTERVQRLTHDEIEERFSDFRRMTGFRAIPYA